MPFTCSWHYDSKMLGSNHHAKINTFCCFAKKRLVTMHMIRTSLWWWNITNITHPNDAVMLLNLPAPSVAYVFFHWLTYHLFGGDTKHKMVMLL